MNQVAFPHISSSNNYNQKENFLLFTKPMAQDDQNSIEQNNDISDISKDLTMEVCPKKVQLKSSILQSQTQPINFRKSEIETEKTVIPKIIIPEIVEHAKIESAIKKEPILILSNRLLQFCLFFLFLENAAILGCQLISWFLLTTFINSTTIIPGIVLLCVYLVVSVLLMLFSERYNMVILKAFEFLLYLTLLCWALVYLDFSFFCLSYMMMYSLLLFWLFVVLLDSFLRNSQHYPDDIRTLGVGSRLHLAILLLKSLVCGCIVVRVSHAADIGTGLGSQDAAGN